MELLQVKELEKAFKNVKAVNGVTFSVNKGEILGLLGPNGAGKSTTISMISTLLSPDKGEILYNGENIVKKPKAIRDRLGFVPQDIALYSLLTGKENLEFWGQAYGIKGKKLKERIEVVSQIIGLDEKLKAQVKTYSGGMKRRLNIGAALLHEPELIIMDEPTVGIDPQSRKHILDTVKMLNQQGMTVIYTSHYMEEVDYLCNRICVMDQGKVIAQGSKQQLVDAHDDKRVYVVKCGFADESLGKQLKDLPTVVDVINMDNQLRITTTKESEEVFMHIINRLNTLGVKILSIDIVEPDLETVFLSLTGRVLRD